MSATPITISQVRYVNKAFWRNPTRAFFTFVFPLMFLVIFAALLGNHTLYIGHLQIKYSSYYVAAMGAFAVISACYTNMAMTISSNRDLGILKRIDGSPMPRSSFLGSRVLHSVLISLVMVAITVAFGRIFYGSTVPANADLGRFLVTVIVGSAAFCALGLAITAAIPNADAAPGLVNASILPLLFLSGIFIPFSNTTPQWIVWVARIFPVRHFASAMQASLIGTPFDWIDVVIVAAWGVAGLLLGLRWFRWEPAGG